MFTPNSIPYQQQPGFQRTFRQGRLSLGLFFPLEAFTGDMPNMFDQVSLAQRVEKLGFSTLWFRDVPLRDPSFGDSGQVFDVWVYLGFMAAHTRSIALGTASVILPIRNPLHTAKAATSVDQLSGGRLLLGVASGDRPVEFPAFGVDPEQRGSLFREYLAVFRQVQLTSFVPLTWSGGKLEGADLIPKPTAAEIPYFVTGHSRQTLEWIARSSHGWITYPRAPQAQQMMVERWRTTVRAECGDVFKPFTQSLYVDLTDNPQTPPRPIHLGYQLGRNHLIALLHALQDEVGVNHVIINLKYGQRPAGEVIEELGEFVLPDFVMST
ncbi:luciferase family protein [Caballeronia temeraria]|uniref:Luciferase family protein n=2 Tax=Caballeronia temeraria TaxID=1777137 RepID=A0A158BWV3_9BURK|nr:luciferase family protein [Caballeronia temeraria]